MLPVVSTATAKAGSLPLPPALTAQVHPLVSWLHLASQARTPPFLPRLTQLAPPRSLPSQASVPFLMPSPHLGQGKQALPEHPHPLHEAAMVPFFPHESYQYRSPPVQTCLALPAQQDSLSNWHPVVQESVPPV